MREGGGSAALAAFEDFPLRHVRPSPLARSAASESQPQHQSPSPGPPLPPSTSFTSRAELVFGSLRPASPSPSGDSAPGRLHGGTGTAPGVEGVPGDPAAEAKSEGAPSWYVSGLAKQPPKAPARVRGPWTVETPVAEPGDGLGVAGGGVHASGGLGSGALVLRQGEGEEEGEEDEEELRSCGWRRRGAGDREGGGFLAESSVMSQKAERQQVAGMVGKDDTLDGEEEEDEFDLFAEGVLPQSARENELVQVSRSGWAGNFSKEVEQVQKILGRMGGEPGGEGRTERWRQGWRVEDRLRVDREGAARRLAEDRASFPPLPSPTQRRELLHPNSGAPPSISPVAGEGKLSSVHLVELTEAMQDSSKGKPVGSGNSVSTELADGSVSRSTAMEGVTDAAVERVEPASGVAGDPDPVAAAAESTGADTGTVKSTGGDASPRTNDADAAHTLVQQLEQQGEQLGSAPGSTRGDGNDAGTDESCRKRRSLSRLSRDSSTATGAAAKATTDSPLVSMGTLSWPTRMSQPFLSSSTRQPRSAAPRSSILESPAGNSDKAGDGTMGTAQGVEEDQSLVSSTRGVARVQQMTGIHAPAGEGEIEEAGPREKEPDGRVGAAEVQPEKGSPSAGRERRLLRGILKRKAAGEQGRERGEEGGVVLGGEGAGRRRRVRFRGMEEGKGLEDKVSRLPPPQRLSSQKASVPDHVRHPQKYTCYALDWSDEEDQGKEPNGKAAGLEGGGGGPAGEQGGAGGGGRGERGEMGAYQLALRDALAAAAASRNAQADDGGPGPVVLPQVLPGGLRSGEEQEDGSRVLFVKRGVRAKAGVPEKAPAAMEVEEKREGAAVGKMEVDGGRTTQKKGSSQAKSGPSLGMAAATFEEETSGDGDEEME